MEAARADAKLAAEPLLRRYLPAARQVSGGLQPGHRAPLERIEQIFAHVGYTVEKV